MKMGDTHLSFVQLHHHGLRVLLAENGRGIEKDRDCHCQRLLLVGVPTLVIRCDYRKPRPALGSHDRDRGVIEREMSFCTRRDSEPNETANKNGKEHEKDKQ